MKGRVEERYKYLCMLQDYARDEGEKNKSIKIVKNMIDKKYDIIDIIKITGLFKEEIEELKSDN